MPVRVPLWDDACRHSRTALSGIRVSYDWLHFTAQPCRLLLHIPHPGTSAGVVPVSGRLTPSVARLRLQVSIPTVRAMLEVLL